LSGRLAESRFSIVKAWKVTRPAIWYSKAQREILIDDGYRRAITIAEVEELVPLGQLDPNEIHTPGFLLHRVFQGKKL